VSSRDQDLAVQLDKLSHCEKVYQEKHTGTTDKRPQLQACLDFVREGDVLVITRLDRLARSLLHLYEIDRLLKQKQVKLQVIERHCQVNEKRRSTSSS
jgi:DNA invertase Pin-like site-specific DNA recombinase